MDIKELGTGVNPNTHWYYQSKKIPLIKYCKYLLKNNAFLSIVDIGAGSGFFSIELTKVFGNKIRKVYLVDTAYTVEEMESTQGSYIQKVVEMPDVQENTLFIMMDVLEHIENEQTILSALQQKKKSNNFFFITVPAFKGLWSGHDVFLGHFRRYTQQLLKEVLLQTNITPQRTYYLYLSLFVPVWLYRKISNKVSNKPNSNMTRMPWLLNRLLLILTSIEMRLTKWNRIAGITCVAQGNL
jgi:hypothetical protein